MQKLADLEVAKQQLVDNPGDDAQFLKCPGGIVASEGNRNMFYVAMSLDELHMLPVRQEEWIVHNLDLGCGIDAGRHIVMLEGYSGCIASPSALERHALSVD